MVPGAIWGTSFLFIAEALEAVAPNGVTFGARVRELDANGPPVARKRGQ